MPGKWAQGQHSNVWYVLYLSLIVIWAGSLYSTKLVSKNIYFISNRTAQMHMSTLIAML